MHDHPHYPPPALQQQQNNDRLGQDLYRGAEIVMIVVAIFGLWNNLAVPLWESVIVPLWNWWRKSFSKIWIETDTLIEIFNCGKAIAIFQGIIALLIAF